MEVSVGSGTTINGNQIDPEHRLQPPSRHAHQATQAAPTPIATIPLQPGDSAPSVTASNQDGETVTPDFDDLTVVYFYVEDGTPDCATQADQFGYEADVYDEAGVTVYGVSTDDVDSHRAFADEHDVDYDLLADPDGDLCEAFGVERDARGHAERTTFVVQDGIVIRTVEGVRADGHARDLLIELYDDGVVDLPF